MSKCGSVGLNPSCVTGVAGMGTLEVSSGSTLVWREASPSELSSGEHPELDLPAGSCAERKVTLQSHEQGVAPGCLDDVSGGCPEPGCTFSQSKSLFMDHGPPAPTQRSPSILRLTCREGALH